ncbi:rhomboid family intramembrane serine protease [bacterium]|nr:MAG: rhomboid family intramembrane serine protease [bacterium]
MPLRRSPFKSAKMFPLKTLPNTKKKPYLTWFLLLANVLIFVVQWFLQVFLDRDLASMWGVVPQCYLSPSACGIVSLETAKPLWTAPFASLFLHANLLHLGFNMLFLSAFGGGLEDKVGRIRFALIYFGGGIAASAAHVAFHPFSGIPVIGASGAIAAVLGAYFIVLPKAWVLTYLPPIFFFPVPAPLFLVVWIFGQLSGALGDFHLGLTSAGGDIAWMAHLGGFLAGVLYGWKVAPWTKKGTFKLRG